MTAIGKVKMRVYDKALDNTKARVICILKNDFYEVGLIYAFRNMPMFYTFSMASSLKEIKPC